MIPLTLAEVADAVGGTLLDADANATVLSVVTDSRSAGPGSLFVALPGERVDGHSFIGDAIGRGAVAALVGTRTVEGPAVRTADPLAALGTLATAMRRRMGATVIAVTGSSGKTCTKDLIAAAVSGERRVVASAASYNNEIGVPLTILSAAPDTDVLVVEVGARGEGHIRSLMSMVGPDVSVVTNVGRAHLGMFGSVEQIASAKSELVAGLSPDGVAILNADDPRVSAMASLAPRVVTFGLTEDADIRAEGVALDGEARASFSLVDGDAREAVALRLAGRHMVPNALAAAAAARAVGVGLAAIADGLSRCDPPAWRMEVRETALGARVINDAYNANPDSMIAAVEALAAMSREARSVAILGVMAELGETSDQHHHEVGARVAAEGIDELVVVGPDAEGIAVGAIEAGMPRRRVHLVDGPAAAVAAVGRPERGTVVLVKASRAAGLERVADALGARA